MPAEYTQSDQFRGARIHLCDLSGLEIRDCDVTGLKIVDCYGGNVSLGGGFERVVVNDVDVTAYVEAELDQLHPNRVLAREATSAAEYRAAWDAIEKQWEETLDRARRLPEAKLHEQVDGEWSFVETQRHLLMASDAWIGNAVLEEDAPYHPLGLPGGGMPAEASAKLGLTLDATPTLDEVLAPRLARVTRYDQLTIAVGKHFAEPGARPGADPGNVTLVAGERDLPGEHRLDTPAASPLDKTDGSVLGSVGIVVVDAGAGADRVAHLVADFNR